MQNALFVLFLNLMVLKSIPCPRIISGSKPLNYYIYFPDNYGIDTYNPIVSTP